MTHPNQHTSRHAANDNRPAEFDRRLAEAYPRLLARARHYSTDPDALVSQAAIVALHRWRSFRQTPGKPYFGFFTWLCWVMKGAAADYKKSIAARIITVSTDAVERPPEIQVSGGQEESVDLATVLGMMTDRERDIMLRKARGETGPEIAAAIGVSRQRVSQIEDEARAKVFAATGMTAANDNGVRKRAA